MIDLGLPRRPGVLGLIAAACLLIPADSAPADDLENLDRLRQIPVGRREELSGNLARFSSLPAPEAAAIRDLDRRLWAEEPSVRARYLAVLRRYHLWLAGLPEARRKAILEAPAAERMTLVREALKDRPKAAPAPGRRQELIWTQMTNLCPATLPDQAYWMRIWLALPPEERKRLDSLRPADGDRIRALEKAGRDRNVPDDRRAVQQSEIDDYVRGLQGRPALRKAFEKAKTKAAQTAMIGRLAEARYLRNHNPQVDRAHLDLFVDALPSWLLVSIDLLPPDAATLRLKVLYRMIFPPGEEMPKPAVSKPKGAATEKPAPDEGPATPSVSF